jgi:hypothetical protein
MPHVFKIFFSQISIFIAGAILTSLMRQNFCHKHIKGLVLASLGLRGISSLIWLHQSGRIYNSAGTGYDQKSHWGKRIISLKWKAAVSVRDFTPTKE